MEMAADKLYLDGLRSKISENIKRDLEKKKRNEDLNIKPKASPKLAEKKQIMKEKASTNANEFESLKSRDKERKRRKREEQFKQTEEKLQDMSLKTKKMDKVSKEAEIELSRMKELAKRLLLRSSENEEGFKETLEFIELSERQREEEDKRKKYEKKDNETHWTEEERNKWPTNEFQDSSKGFTNAMSMLKVSNMGKNELDTLKGSISNVKSIKKETGSQKISTSSNTSLLKNEKSTETATATPTVSDSVNGLTKKTAKDLSISDFPPSLKTTITQSEFKTSEKVLGDGEVNDKKHPVKISEPQNIAKLSSKVAEEKKTDKLTSTAKIAGLNQVSSKPPQHEKSTSSQMKPASGPKSSLELKKNMPKIAIKSENNNGSLEQNTGAGEAESPSKVINSSPEKPVEKEKEAKDSQLFSLNNSESKLQSNQNKTKTKSATKEPVQLSRSSLEPRKELEKPKTVIKFKDGNISEIIKLETDNTSKASNAATNNLKINKETPDLSVKKLSFTKVEENTDTERIRVDDPKPASDLSVKKVSITKVKKDTDTKQIRIDDPNPTSDLSVKKVSVTKIKEDKDTEKIRIDDPKPGGHLQESEHSSIKEQSKSPSKSRKSGVMESAEHIDQLKLPTQSKNIPAKPKEIAAINVGSNMLTTTSEIDMNKSEQVKLDQDKKNVSLNVMKQNIDSVEKKPIDKLEPLVDADHKNEPARKVKLEKAAKVHSVNPTTFIPKSNEVEAIKLGSPSLMKKVKSDKNYQISKVPTEIVLLPSKKAILNGKHEGKNIQVENYKLTKVPTEKFIFNKKVSNSKEVHEDLTNTKPEVQASVVINVTRPPPPKSKPPPPPPAFKPPPPPPLF